MKTIVILSQKGGSGKTTLAAALAVEAARDGEVWVVDTDKQGSLSEWHERRADGLQPHRLETTLARLPADLAALDKRGAAYCLIDTAPTVSPENDRILELADLAVVPVEPSPLALWSVGETVERVKASQKPFRFAVTRAKLRASITAQTVAALSQHGVISQALIGDRVLYASAMTGGQTAPELGRGRDARHCAEEIGALWVELKACFHAKKSLRLVKKAAKHG